MSGRDWAWAQWKSWLTSSLTKSTRWSVLSSIPPWRRRRIPSRWSPQSIAATIHDVFMWSSVVAKLLPLLVAIWKSREIKAVKNIVEAFQGMHVSPANYSFGKCDRQTDRRTDDGQSDPCVSLCFAGNTWRMDAYRSRLEKYSLFASCQRGRYCVKPFRGINMVHQHSTSGIKFWKLWDIPVW